MIDVPERERPDRISVLLVIQGMELGVLVWVPLSQDVLVAGEPPPPWRPCGQSAPL